MSTENTIILQKIKAISSVNNEIVQRIQDKVNNKGMVCRSRKFSLESGEVFKLVEKVEETSALDIVSGWKPKIPKENFHNTEDMNIFNDNINYTCTSFDDVKRLNESIPKVSFKFRLLDPNQSPPILRLFYSNLEILQTFLGDLEGLLMDPESPKKELLKAVQTLNDAHLYVTQQINEKNMQEAKRIGDTFIPGTLSWDPKFCHDSLKINGMEVVSTGSSQAVLGTLPNVASFKVKPLSGSNSNIMVGLALQSKVQNKTYNYDKSGWFLYLQETNLFGLSGESHKPYNNIPTNKIPLNSTVEVCFDKSARTISFVVNGVNQGVAFSNIPIEENLYPCVEFHEIASVVLL